MMNNRLINKAFSILQFASDLHLERGYKRDIIPLKPCLVLAGDIGYPNQNSYKQFLLGMSHKFDKVFVISGNHEFDNLTNPFSIEPVEYQIRNICALRNNLFYLQKSQHVIDDADNIILAGCTLFSELPKSKNDYHYEHTLWLRKITKENKNNNYVIATHHCPHVSLLTRKYYNFVPRYFASNQKEVFSRDNVFMWLYGHSHDNVNAMMDNTLFMTNQYGGYKYPIKNYRK